MRFEPEDVSAIADAVVSKLQILPKNTLVASDSNERLGCNEDEASKLLGVPGHVLRDARRRGEIRARKIGKRWIYSFDSLVAYLQPES